MDFKSKCRTWTGNMYHKFEAIFHEVDDFVGKDNVKYLENQVQIVGESVKKVYAKVLYDSGPPMAYNKQRENCASTKHEEAIGSYTRSAVGCSGIRSCQQEDSAGDIDCNDYQNNLNPSTLTEFSENPNCLNPEDDENIVAIENHSACKYFGSGDGLPSYTDWNPLIVRSNYIERSSVEHLLPVTSESSESNSIFGSDYLSDVGDCMCNADSQTNASNEDVLVEEKDYLCALQEENSLSTGLQLIHIDENTCNNIEHYELIGGDSSSDIYGDATNFDESVELEGKYDETVGVEYTSCIVKYENPFALYMGDNHLIAEASTFLENEFSEHGNDIHPNTFVKFGLIPEYLGEGRGKTISDGSEQVERPCALYTGDKHLMAEASNFLENDFSEHGNDIHPETLVKFELIPDYLGEGREKPISDGSEQVERADTRESSKCVCLDESVADNLVHFCRDTSSTSTSNSGCGDDSAVDLDDSNMENIYLSNEAKAEDACHGCGDKSAVDTDDSNMENVDLSNEVTPEEASLMNDWLVHRASCRPRKAKSYKRLVLDALRSRKQMIKEYKQLAILCGEIDDDKASSLRKERSVFHPPVAAGDLCTGPSPRNDSCEAGWELV